MCGAHATVRGFLGELIARAPHAQHVVVDMEAGLEHLSRGTGRHLSRVLAIVEPYFRSMETARRIKALSTELGVAEVAAITNKVRGEADRAAVSAYCRDHGLDVIGEVPYDQSLADAERSGAPPIDFSPGAPSVVAIGRIADLLQRR